VRDLCDALDSAFQKFVDKRLVGLFLPGGQATKLSQHLSPDSYGDERLGVAAFRAAEAGGAPQLFIRGFQNILGINLPVGNMLCTLWGSPAAP
jgi:hypothetical protein